MSGREVLYLQEQGRSSKLYKCDHKLKGKFYKTTIRPTMLYGIECRAVKNEYIYKMRVFEMRMLRWISGYEKRKYRIQDKEIRLKIGMTPIDEKTRDSHMR